MDYLLPQLPLPKMGDLGGITSVIGLFVGSAGLLKLVGIAVTKYFERRIEKDKQESGFEENFVKWMQARLKEMEQDCDELRSKLDDKALQESGFKIQIMQLQSKMEMKEAENLLLKNEIEQLIKEVAELRGMLNKPTK